VGVAVAIFVFYRSGVRQAGQGPQAVGAPVTGMKAPPPAEAQPLDPASGLQIYKTEGGKAVVTAPAPTFAPPPERPQARAEAPAPQVVVTPAPPAAPATPAPTLRPALSTQPPAAAKPAPAATPAALKPAPKAEAPVAKPPPAKPQAPKPEPKAATPAPAAKTPGAAAVQIGAFSSQALADKGWADAAAISPGLAAGKGKSVEKVDKDGKTLFRTQVTGFASRADAAAFCDKLKAAGKACFVK